MYNRDVNGVNGGNNAQWNKKLAEQLDMADGKKDGKISANVWNEYLNSVGSTGNKIKNFINVNNAEKSFNYYQTKKDNGKADWSNWETKLNDFKKSHGLSIEHTTETKPAETAQTTAKPTAAAETKQKNEKPYGYKKLFEKDDFDAIDRTIRDDIKNGTNIEAAKNAAEILDGFGYYDNGEHGGKPVFD